MNCNTDYKIFCIPISFEFEINLILCLKQMLLSFKLLNLKHDFNCYIFNCAEFKF